MQGVSRSIFVNALGKGEDFGHPCNVDFTVYEEKGRLNHSREKTEIYAQNAGWGLRKHQKEMKPICNPSCLDPADQSDSPEEQTTKSARRGLVAKEAQLNLNVRSKTPSSPPMLVSSVSLSFCFVCLVFVHAASRYTSRSVPSP